MFDITTWETNNYNTYWLISWEVKKSNEEIWSVKLNIKRETFFWKSYTQNVVEKLVPDPFLKNRNWAYASINTLKFYTGLLLYLKMRAIELDAFFIRKIFIWKWASKIQNLKKIYRKSPASDAQAEILKNADFPRALQKLQSWVNSTLFSYSKLFSFSIIKKMTFIVSVKPN